MFILWLHSFYLYAGSGISILANSLVLYFTLSERSEIFSDYKILLYFNTSLAAVLFIIFLCAFSRRTRQSKKKLKKSATGCSRVYFLFPADFVYFTHSFAFFSLWLSPHPYVIIFERKLRLCPIQII
jgi:hypothetical protein